jgi:hypothetical protein
MRSLCSSLLISLLRVAVKDSSLMSEAMAKTKKNAGFEPKEPPEHKTDIKVGLHLDHLLAVSAPPSARHAHSTSSTPVQHPQLLLHPLNPLHPMSPQHRARLCWHFEPSAIAPLHTATVYYNRRKFRIGTHPSLLSREASPMIV